MDGAAGLFADEGAPPMMITNMECKVCGGKEFIFKLKGRDRLHHLQGEFDIYRCKRCGLLFVYPFLDEAALKKYYPKDYYSYSDAQKNENGVAVTGKLAYYLKHPLKAANALLYSKILRQNKDVALSSGQAVLDVGCGDGKYLLEKMKSGCRCYGVDISREALRRLKEKASDIETYCGDLWDAKFPSEAFDLVNLSHVLEHVQDIDRLLLEVRRILKKDGLLKVQVPNAASLTSELYGRYWIGWDTPRHLYVFS